MIIKALEPIWVSKAETASRIRQRMETVWDYGKARGYIVGENPARLKGHLDKILPNTSRLKEFAISLPYPTSRLGSLLKSSGINLVTQL